MQKVEIYHNLADAKFHMDRHLNAGWSIHTCTMSGNKNGYSISHKVLVVYEKEN